MGEPVLQWDMTGRADMPVNVRSYFTGGVEGAVADYALLLGNSTTTAKVSFFLEQHRDAPAVEDRHLQRLRAHRPRQPHYEPIRKRGWAVGTDTIFRVVCGKRLSVPCWGWRFRIGSMSPAGSGENMFVRDWNLVALAALVERPWEEVA